MTMPDGDQGSRGPGGAIASGGDAIQRLPYTQPDLERARRLPRLRRPWQERS